METPPSITKFAAFVQLKDFRGPTQKEYVRYVRKCGEHFQCDPLTLTEDQLRWVRVQDREFLVPQGKLAARFKGRSRRGCNVRRRRCSRRCPPKCGG